MLASRGPVVEVDRGELENILKRACRMDVVAFKPGNVSLWSAGHGMCAEDFLASAEVAVPALSTPGQGCGARIRSAVSATMDQVGCNTNLGIILLLAPLAAAAQRYAGGSLRRGLRDILDPRLAER